MKQRKNYLCSAFRITFVITLLYLIALIALASCTATKRLQESNNKVERVFIHDTLRLTTQKVDSFFRLDSVFQSIETRGDTVYFTRERWKERIKTVLRVDTVYKASQRDTIMITEKQTEKQTVKRSPLDTLISLLFLIAGIASLALLLYVYFKSKSTKKL